MRKNILTGLVTLMIITVSVFGFSGCGANDEKGKETAADITIAGSSSVQPLSESLAEVFMDSNEEINVTIQGGGSGQGIKSVEKGIAEIGSLSRKVKEGEKQSVEREYLIAMDGIAVVVNKDVSVTDLTLEQIRDIYTGKITNWKEVGGADHAITVITREEGSGTRTSFTEITGVLQKDSAGGEKDEMTVDALVQPSTGAVRETVATTPDSIGYVSLNVLDNTVRTVKVEGMEATVENVHNGSYQISRPFFYVTGKKVSAAAKRFIDFVMSEEGQKVVEESGFIPVE